MEPDALGHSAHYQGDFRTADGLPLSVHGQREGRPAVATGQERVGLVQVDDIARLYDFGETHPLRPERVLLTYDHIADLGLMERATSIPARVATDAEIRAAHDAEFVEAVKAIDAGTLDARAGLDFGLGTSDDPIFPEMHRASAAVCGATITAAEAVLGSYGHSFNPAGGLHHARRREASGFCIYNDPAVAIAYLLAERPDWRVMYLDVDVHHGDGVQWIFYDEPRVLTVSLHQSGHYLYPGTGFEDEIGRDRGTGTAANVPLLPLTGDADYLWALEHLLEPLARAFRPDVLVTQLGADTHWGDPLANLGLTMRAYPAMARLIHEIVDEHIGSRWIATGGGGYQFDTIVPKVWTMHFAEMCGAADAIPAEWFEDRPAEEVSRPWRSEVERSVERVLDACLDRLESLPV